MIQSFLKKRNLDYNIFVYEQRYNEENYINCLQQSKYGIWVGRHESQGFALEEALSCNVPLFVWDVVSINQEEGCNYPDIPATTIPYWDERCGESFTDIKNIDEKFDIFLSKLNEYKPREYVIENLSVEKCTKNLERIIQELL